MADGPLEITLRVAAILDDLRIPYVLGGSMASSLLGEPRATADVDFAIRIDEEHIASLVAQTDPNGSEASEEVARMVRFGASPRAAIFSGVSAALNSAGVALLTPISVAWADKTTATNSVKGDE